MFKEGTAIINLNDNKDNPGGDQYGLSLYFVSFSTRESMNKDKVT